MRTEPPYIAHHDLDACEQCICLGCYRHIGEPCRCDSIDRRVE